jgi:hypothetical protein
VSHVGPRPSPAGRKRVRGWVLAAGIVVTGCSADGTRGASAHASPLHTHDVTTCIHRRLGVCRGPTAGEPPASAGLQGRGRDREVCSKGARKR